MGAIVPSAHMVVMGVVVPSTPPSDHVPPCFYLVKVLKVNVFGGYFPVGLEV
jgi:hypothetical protein